MYYVPHYKYSLSSKLIVLASFTLTEKKYKILSFMPMKYDLFQ